MKLNTIGFIGFGLIGGSIAKNLRKNHPDSHIIAYNYHKTKNIALEQAKKDSILNLVSEDLEKDFADCDLIFLCAPVLSNIAYLKQLKPIIREDCIITDVGSVKGNIHEAVRELDMEKNFIGGHPMTGSEKTGYDSADLSLMENAYYILTPNEETPGDAVSEMLKLVKDIGAIPILLDCKEHDDITSAISHVPHIIAAQLVNMIHVHDTDKKMSLLAAGGFKDITRIASSSPVMWQNICLTNKESILKFLRIYISSLEQAADMLEGADEAALLEMFQSSKEFRDSIPNTASGLLPKNYKLLVDVQDKAGELANIATLLAAADINIKNMGILNNREYENGVLAIELEKQSDIETAVRLLRQKHYTIYEN